MASALLKANGISSSTFKNFSAGPSLNGESSLKFLSLCSSSFVGAIFNKLSSNSLPRESALPVEGGKKDETRKRDWENSWVRNVLTLVSPRILRAAEHVQIIFNLMR